MIANAAMTCEDHFGFGDDYQGYCNLECGFNVYDATADTSAGDCDALIAAGFSCADSFDVGGDYEGHCDFSCGFCTQPATASGAEDAEQDEACGCSCAAARTPEERGCVAASLPTPAWRTADRLTTPADQYPTVRQPLFLLS